MSKTVKPKSKRGGSTVAKKGPGARTTTAGRSGGANIKAKRVRIRGDVVGRDKIVQQVYQQSPAPVVSALHQLRAPLQDFKGREAEIARLKQELHQGHSISICGLGGTGKTELALLIANDLSAEFSDAQLFIELHGSDPTPRQPKDALTACIRAFVGREVKLPGAEAELISIYRSNLSGKRALIVLDDAADDAQVRPFLPPPGCVLVITSRQRLTTRSVTRLTLNEFSPNEAYSLLVNLAPHTERPIPVSMAELPSAEAQAIRQRRVVPELADLICYLCGDLPLAIRAAGSLLSVNEALDPAAYVTRLRNERTRLERIGMEGVELGVEACFSSSYAHLSPETARVFRYLAIFPDTFTSDIEEVVCQDEDHRQLDNLIKRSLVTYSSATTRYRLHDLVRVFIAKRLAQSQEKTATKNIIKSLKDATRRYERAMFFGDCLLNPHWKLSGIRAAVLEALCSIMLDEQFAQADRRKVAFLLTRLRWLDDTRVSRSEVIVYLELIMRYVYSPDDLIWLKQCITTILGSSSAEPLNNEKIEMHVYLASLQVRLEELDEAEQSYTQARQCVGSNAESLNYQKASARINFGFGNIAVSRGDSLSQSDAHPQRVELLEQAVGFYMEAAKLAEMYSNDPILEFSIYSEINYVYVLLLQWEKAEQYYHRAQSALETGQLQVTDPEAYVRHYAEVLEVASDTHLKKGQSLITQAGGAAALEEFEKVYGLTWQEITMLRKFFGKSGHPLLAYAHTNAGDTLWEMSRCPDCRVIQPQQKACRHWRKALSLSLRLGIRPVTQVTKQRLEQHCAHREKHR